MSDTPWTPGPWKFTETTEGDPVVVYVDLPSERAGPDAASVLFEADWGTEADARLTAAAPEMADFLTTVADQAAQGVIPVWVIGAWGELLSRIRGEQ